MYVALQKRLVWAGDARFRAGVQLSYSGSAQARLSKKRFVRTLICMNLNFKSLAACRVGSLKASTAAAGLEKDW